MSEIDKEQRHSIGGIFVSLLRRRAIASSSSSSTQTSLAMDLLAGSLGHLGGSLNGGLRTEVLEFTESATADPRRIPNEQRRTSPLMTKYELSRVLGTRALQLRFVPRGSLALSRDAGVEVHALLTCPHVYVMQHERSTDDRA